MDASTERTRSVEDRDDSKLPREEWFKLGCEERVLHGPHRTAGSRGEDGGEPEERGTAHLVLPAGVGARRTSRLRSSDMPPRVLYMPGCPLSRRLGHLNTHNSTRTMIT